MGRRYIYFCDDCGRDFKNDIHLNIKGGQMAISFPNKINEQDYTKSGWAQKSVPLPCQEYHFCNDVCFGNFIKKKITDLIEKLHTNNLTKEK